MRHFIAVAALASGGFAFARSPVSLETPPTDASAFDFSHLDAEGEDRTGDLDLDRGVLLFEVQDPTLYVIPSEDVGEAVVVLAISKPEEGVTLDIAGVQRTPAGRVVDALPGTPDAADTGMQHDVGLGTVRNTGSPDPTPSPVVQAAVAAHEEVRETPAPAAQEPLETDRSSVE